MPKVYEDEELKTALAEYQDCHNYAEVGRRLGLARSTVQYQIEQATRRNLNGSAILKHGEDDLPPGMELSGVSQHFPKLGWVKMKPVNGLADAMDAIDGAFKRYDGLMKPRTVSPGPVEPSLLTMYPVPDLHLGMLSWRKETGEAYDIDIASDLLRVKAADLMDRTPDSAVGVVLNLGDFFHADNNNAATPEHGNHLDVDSRHQKVQHRGVEVMIDLIEMARQKHNKVIVRSLPGNHDPISSVALGDALYWAYRLCPEVTVDIDPSPFWAYRWGRTMLAAHHGHMVKPTEFAGKMSAFWPEIWGVTDARFGLMGHLHRAIRIPADEKNGAEVRVLGTLAAKDAWNRGMGHASARTLKSITYTNRGGEYDEKTETVHTEDLK
jgi:hypothetical protein